MPRRAIGRCCRTPCYTVHAKGEGWNGLVLEHPALLPVDAQVSDLRNKTVLFRCKDAHPTKAEALECAWQARLRLGLSVGDPVDWTLTEP